MPLSRQNSFRERRESCRTSDEFGRSPIDWDRSPGDFGRSPTELGFCENPQENAKNSVAIAPGTDSIMTKQPCGEPQRALWLSLVLQTRDWRIVRDLRTFTHPNCLRRNSGLLKA